MIQKLLLILLFFVAPSGIPEQDYRTVGCPVPEIRVADRKGVIYSNSDITEGRNFFLVMFNPTCGHCKEFAASVMQHQELFEENTIFLMTTPDKSEYLAEFVAETGWIDGGELRIGIDSGETIKKTYNYTTLPQINVYDKDQKMIRIMGSVSSVDSLRKFIY